MRCTMCNFNLCVLCYFLFHSDVDTLKMKDSISKIFKGLKAIKITKFCTFVGYKILHNASTTIMVAMGGIIP